MIPSFLHCIVTYSKTSFDVFVMLSLVENIDSDAYVSFMLYDASLVLLKNNISAFPFSRAFFL